MLLLLLLLLFYIQNTAMLMHNSATAHICAIKHRHLKEEGVSFKGDNGKYFGQKSLFLPPFLVKSLFLPCFPLQNTKNG